MQSKPKSKHPAYVHGESAIGKYPSSGNAKHTRLYRAWHHLKDDKSIAISKDWERSFTSFRSWAILNGYDENAGMTHFVRRNKSYGWCPENVTITSLVPAHRVFLTHGDITMSLCDWAKHLGMSKQKLWARLYVCKWPVDRALEEGVEPVDECTFG